MKAFALAVFAGASLNAPAGAAERQTVLAVDNMTCAACPYVVRQALKAVAGVRAAEVDFVSRRAVVICDDAVTSTPVLTAATANAGFPSRAAPR